MSNAGLVIGGKILIIFIQRKFVNIKFEIHFLFNGKAVNGNTKLKQIR